MYSTVSTKRLMFLFFLSSLSHVTQDAALKWNGPRQVSLGERIILTEHQPKRTEDGEYSSLMKSSNGEDMSASRLMPLHSYYGEFRLGQGDPLLKSAMRQWPCTTTDFSDPESSNPSHSRGVTKSCTALMDPSSMMPFNDIVNLQHLDLEHEGTVRERRFVILDEDGNELASCRRFSF
ncbi:MAG: hypothetical protein SGARI_004388 [Bacillariaceae sp.]